MKRFFYIAIIIMVIASCQEQPKKDANAIEPIENAKNLPQQLKKEIQSPPIDPLAWKIDDPTALKMKKYLKGCVFGCVNNFDVIDSNQAVYKAIQDRYPNGVITLVYARYKDKADEDRYCSLRKLTNPDACRVKNHKTFIYKVTLPSSNPTSGSINQTPTELYFDIITICPPPRDCGSQDTSFHHS